MTRRRDTSQTKDFLRILEKHLSAGGFTASFFAS